MRSEVRSDVLNSLSDHNDDDDDDDDDDDVRLSYYLRCDVRKYRWRQFVQPPESGAQPRRRPRPCSGT